MIRDGFAPQKEKKAYARAGVDVDLANKLKRDIGAFVRQTHGPQVLGKIGGFGGLFRASFPGMREPVLVASVDGVGTKLKIAFAMDKHDTVGVDLVNHCVDDIAVLGARPLFFLDYIGCERLELRLFQLLSCPGCIARVNTISPVASLASSIERKSSMAARLNPATSFSVWLQMVCIPMATRWHAKFCSRKCGSSRVRLYPGQQ